MYSCKFINAVIEQNLIIPSSVFLIILTDVIYCSELQTQANKKERPIVPQWYKSYSCWKIRKIVKWKKQTNKKFRSISTFIFLCDQGKNFAKAKMNTSIRARNMRIVTGGKLLNINKSWFTKRKDYWKLETLDSPLFFCVVYIFLAAGM